MAGTFPVDREGGLTRQARRAPGGGVATRTEELQSGPLVTSSRITVLLQRSREGDKDALESVLPLLYRELRRIAAGQLARERAGHTLQPTALVHEAYLRLVDQEQRDWVDRGHFLALAATAMRRVLVHHAERRAAAKRGGDLRRVTLPAELAGEDLPDMIALDRALERLAAIDPRGAQVVELRFFGGLSNEEAAGVLGLSSRTVEREWRVTRAWLRRELDEARS
jgi:RNA polymerase sigma factor (TIGR02999 family)